jgi:magnesium chelatase family protein
MAHADLETHCALDAAGKKLLEAGMRKYGLSARAHDRILKMARTIADLEGAETIQPPHLSEALNYRTLELWGFGV